MENDILREIGLSETESRIYLSLINSGATLAGEISKHCDINRTHTYDALEKLVNKGLVSYILNNNRKLYNAVNPARLREILTEKEDRLNETITKLEEKYKTRTPKEEITVFKGRNGLKSIFEDVLTEKATLYAYGGQHKFSSTFPIYQKQWMKKRFALGIKIKIIYALQDREKKEKGLKNIEMRFLPEQYDFPSMILIYADKVVNVIWEEEPVCILIKTQKAAKSHLAFFELLWKIAKK